MRIVSRKIGWSSAGTINKIFSFVADGTGSSTPHLESDDLGVVSEEDGTLKHSKMVLVLSKTRRVKGTAHGLTDNFVRTSQARLTGRRPPTEMLKPENANEKRTRRQRGEI